MKKWHKKLHELGCKQMEHKFMWEPYKQHIISGYLYVHKNVPYPCFKPVQNKLFVIDDQTHVNIMGDSSDLFDEFEEFLKSFDIDLDDNDVDIAKAKKPDPMYCNCDKPDIVKRGFSHIAYDYCKTCRKEKISE